MRSIIFISCWLLPWGISATATWWAWHLPPVPCCVCEDSDSTIFYGFSDDGRMVSAEIEPKDSDDRPTGSVRPLLRVWSAETGRILCPRIENASVDYDDSAGCWSEIRQWDHADQMHRFYTVSATNGD